MSPRHYTLSLALFIFILIPQAPGADPRGDNPDAPSSTPAEQLKKFHVPPGFEVQLVAAEPQIQKPINLTFDAAGRLWVTGSELYPWPASVDALGQPIPDFDKGYADIASAFRVGDKAPPASKIAKDSVRVLSDFAPDGTARKIEVFADGLNIPSGVQPLPRKPGAKGDTAIVYSIPNIWRLEDTDGDGKADKREVLYGMFGYLDTHGGSSSYLYWIDGWIYGTHGFRNRSEVRDRNGKVTTLDSGNTYRFRPDGSAFEIYTYGQTNPFGLTVDPYGNFYSADSHSKPVYMLVPGGYYEGIGKQHDGLGFAPRITDDDHGSSAIAGIAYYADDKYPEEFRGNLFNGNPVTQRINRDKLEWHGSTPKAIRQPDFVTCDDPWFRPVQVKLGPDGALYIADFYNPIIGHYEFPLADPRRDHTHGRIWRVVWRGENKDAPPVAVPDLTKLDGSALAQQFKNPNLEVRRMATNELVDRVGAAEAVPSLRVALGNETVTSTMHVENAMWSYARLGHEKHARDYIGFITNLMSIHSAKLSAENASLSREDLDKWVPWLNNRDKRVERAIAEILCRHPSPKNLALILSILPTVPAEDSELIYTLRMALRNGLAEPDGYALAALITEKFPESNDLLADVSLAIKTPQSAAFLLSYLQTTKLRTPRAGEFLKHALLHLPPDKLEPLLKLISQADETSPAQKLALAASLTDAARQRNLTLPPEVSTWSHRIILDAVASGQDDLAKPAIASLRDAKFDTKLEPLAIIVRDENRDGSLRLSALEATANLPAARELLVSTFQSSRHMILRKRAAELLAQNNQNEVLLTALSNVPEELAISISGALARTDTGATSLLDRVEAGKTSPRLLLNKAVAGPLIARPKPIRDRAQSLVKDLPPEDARLNAVIAERAAAFAKAQVDAAHGAQVFQQTCAACHRFRNAGGNIGPNLDGVIARGPTRVIEDILDPNRNVDPLFRQTTIETTDGETILGGNVRDQGATLVLSDLTGKDVTVQKSRVKKQSVSPVSLMPAIFEAALPAKDFNDLLGFLLSPAQGP